jgi:hypothetical protein
MCSNAKKNKNNRSKFKKMKVGILSCPVSVDVPLLSSLLCSKFQLSSSRILTCSFRFFETFHAHPTSSKFQLSSF